jgi:hypothetical protein
MDYLCVDADVGTRAQFALAPADRTGAHHVHGRGGNQLHVMPVCGRDFNGQRHACGFSERAALDTAFAAITRVGTYFSPFSIR